MNYDKGCCMPIDDWIWLNEKGIFEKSDLLRYASPFPPVELMQNVSGLVSERDFASHGVHFFSALAEASPRDICEYKNVLDFGCGCGRLARMFKGHAHNVFGCDIDRRHIEWINHNLTFMKASVTAVHPPTPYHDSTFDMIVSISVFTHLNEESQNEFLSELYRISSPHAYLFLTVHGETALKRALREDTIREMLAVDSQLFEEAQEKFWLGKHAFILQQGHLTVSGTEKGEQKNGEIINERFEYGITFIPEEYIRGRWSEWFKICDYRKGALHSFQDIVVLSPKGK